MVSRKVMDLVQGAEDQPKKLKKLVYGYQSTEQAEALNVLIRPKTRCSCCDHRVFGRRRNTTISV